MYYKNNILATLAYYDVLDFPLKEEEVFRFLVNLERRQTPENPRTSDFDEIKIELEKLRSENIVNFYDGFYFLFDRNYLVPLRLRREKIAKKKWRKTCRAVWWLKFLPYIRAVFASGSLAMSNTEELGDLDILIIVKRGRIWLSRLLISGLMSLIGMRRKYNQKIAPDKICLNHYITDRSLTIPCRSIYTAQTYVNLRPIFVSNPRIVTEFYKANSWLGDYVLNFEAEESAAEKINTAISHNFLTKIKSRADELILNTRLGDRLENSAKRWQINRIEKHRKQDPPGGRVVYNDGQLEFHPGSVETEVIGQYNRWLNKLGLGELAIEKDSGLS